MSAPTCVARRVRRVQAAVARLCGSGPAIALGLVLGSCRCADGSAQPAGMLGAPSSLPAAPRAPSSVEPSPVSVVAPTAVPTLMLALPSSAYHASLEADEDGFVLLTRTAAHRLVPGREPFRTSLDLAFGATTTQKSVLFWSEGAVLRAPKSGGTVSRLAALPARPQRFVASGDRFAWLTQGENGFSIHTLDGSKPSLTYASRGRIEALAMLSDWVFFVERPTDGSWRIGGVKSLGGTPGFTAPRPGRAPAMLVGAEQLYYYDGNSFEIRRLTPDLAQEETLAKGFVCSPLAVFEHVYCAQVEGLFELRSGASPRRLVPAHLGAPITSLAVNATHVAFVTEAGADRLEVKLIPR